MGQQNSTVEVLIVDDDEGHAELIKRNLQRVMASSVVTAISDGQAALDYILGRGSHASDAAHRQLLVLLDINMPGLDGMEVLRQVKADPVKKRTPIVMLSTTHDARKVDQCYELGCSAYVQKPTDPATFTDAISKLGLFISVINLPVEDEKT